MKHIVFIAAFLALQPTIGLAQSFDSLVIRQSPENAKAGESVRLELQSFSDDLDRSTITWYLSQKIVLQGTGKKVYTTTMPSQNNSKIVSVTVVTAQGKTMEQELELKPAGIDLLVEAIDSYTPPFYRGKALPGEEGIIRVVAMPATQKAQGGANTFVYQWKRNGSNLPAFSGYGKQSFTMQFDPFNDSERVGVIYNQDSEEELIVVPQKVELRVYEVSPKIGVLHQKEITQEISLAENEISLVAEPYFFSPGNKFSGILTYLWTLNDKIVQNNNDRSTIVLRGSGSATGLGSIEVRVANTVKSLQRANKNIRIRFD